MAQSFSQQEWEDIFAHARDRLEEFGLPERRSDSVVLGSFNIRHLSGRKRSDGAWRLLQTICERYDLLAIQEVKNDLEGLRKLHGLIGRDFEKTLTDTTGYHPAETSLPAERLAFFHRTHKVRRLELASEITFDRGRLAKTLFTNRDKFQEVFTSHARKCAKIEAENIERVRDGKRKKRKPSIPFPMFLTFIRQPFCVAYEIGPPDAAKPYRLLTVNCHLLYGDDPKEREWEFQALVEWLVARAKHPEKLYCRDILLLGDCNLEFRDTGTRREKIDAFLKDINAAHLGEAGNAKCNFPFLDPHPRTGVVFRTAARQKDTYDQVGIIFRDKRLPDHGANAKAGETPGGYDYGVFNFVELFKIGRAHSELQSQR